MPHPQKQPAAGAALASLLIVGLLAAAPSSAQPSPPTKSTEDAKSQREPKAAATQVSGPRASEAPSSGHSTGKHCEPTEGGERTAPGLRVYVDPETGELTSNPPPRRPGLRILESQSMPATGNVDREIVEIPGIGVGVFVGDLFVHSMKAVPTQQEGQNACADETAPRQKGGLPVAVQ